jgi:hypothetical protein
LLLECERGGAWWLQKCPLTLSDAEKQKVEQGVRSPKRAPDVTPESEKKNTHKA